MTLASYLAFCGLCLVLTFLPGPDTFLTLRYSMRQVRTGIASACGSGVGTIVWAALVAVGLAAVIEQSAELYRLLKILGGLYLIYLGVQAFRHARAGVSTKPAGARRGGLSVVSAFGAGLLSTVMNPKVGLFFLAVVPQFLPHDGSSFAVTMGLGATEAFIAITYLCVLSLAAAKANAWLRRPRVSSNLERITGGILAVLGIGTVAVSVAE
jgi:Putative threonine efflux protein